MTSGPLANHQCQLQGVPCDYGCVFGISDPCESIEAGSSNSVFRKHQSYILNGGPGGRVYWFYFFKLPQRAYGDDIPTYTEEDKERTLKERENDDITPTLKFKEVLEKRISSVLVPLQEYVFRQWHYKRIMTIGDSAHKVCSAMRASSLDIADLTSVPPHRRSRWQCVHRILSYPSQRSRQSSQQTAGPQTLTERC